MKITKNDATALFADLLGTGEAPKTIEEIKTKRKVRRYTSKWRFVAAETIVFQTQCANCGTCHHSPNRHVLFKYERVRTYYNHQHEDTVMDTHETYIPRAGVTLPEDIEIETVYQDCDDVAFCQNCSEGKVARSLLLQNLPDFIDSRDDEVAPKTEGFELTSLVKDDGSEDEDMSLMSADDILDYLETGGELPDEL